MKLICIHLHTNNKTPLKMSRQICNGCGGYIGLDCFNPVECEWISRDEERIREQSINDRIRKIEEDNKKLREELVRIKQNQNPQP